MFCLSGTAELQSAPGGPQDPSHGVPAPALLPSTLHRSHDPPAQPGGLQSRPPTPPVSRPLPSDHHPPLLLPWPGKSPTIDYNVCEREGILISNN